MALKGFRKNKEGKWFVIEASKRAMIPGDIYVDEVEEIYIVNPDGEHVEIDDSGLMSQGIGEVGMHEGDDDDG